MARGTGADGKSGGAYFEPAARSASASAASGSWICQEALDSVEGLQGLSLNVHRHEAHGTTAVLAKVAGPLCSVGMIFATEACDDKGLVHCLEHLCFMGSESYRKGYLDLLAVRSGCGGANAYTETDHTCFEFEAAGEVGLLAVLPVFVDHVLCPALNEDSFITEIHHINGKGERQGVVFSEMLGRVNDELDMLDLERRKATFGDTSPYSFEHGGLPDIIMKLTRAEVSEYHREVYATDNLYVIISGNFGDARVLDALDGALSRAVAHGAKQKCGRRPFCTPLPAIPLSCPRRRTIRFPSEDVSVGSVSYSHRLPGVAYDDMETLTALDILGRFLTGLASSPLEQAFVQCDPPVAAGIACNVNPTAEPYLTIELSGIPFRASASERAAAKKLGGGAGDDSDDEEASEGDQEEDTSEDEVDASDEEHGSGEEGGAKQAGEDWFVGDHLLWRLVAELRSVMNALASGDKSAISSLSRAITKEQVQRRVDFEDGPSDFVRDVVLPNLLFGRYPGDKAVADPAGPRRLVLSALSAESAALASLPGKRPEWWADLLNRHLLQPLLAMLRWEECGSAEVRSCPSAALCLEQERREEREAKKIAKAFGKKKLKALQQRVDQAEQANNKPLDDDERASFPPPANAVGAPDYRWSMEQVAAPQGGGLEVLEVEVASNFLELQISWALDNTVLPGREGAELRSYFGLLAALVCETDVSGEGYRSVVSRLDDELVSCSAECGLGVERLSDRPGLCQFTLKLSAEPQRREAMVTWADKLIHDCEFPEERVLSICRRMITGIKESMRDAGFVLPQVMTLATYAPISPQVQLGSLAQRSFLERCCMDIPASCRALYRLRDILIAPTTSCAAVVTGATSECRGTTRESLQKAWCARHCVARPSLLAVVRWTANASPMPSPLLPLRHFVVGCAGAEAATLHLRAELPANQPPLALDAKGSGALLLTCEALSMMGGPLSAVVRGKGLAYGASVGYSSTENAVMLDLWECTNLRKALESALDVIREVAEDSAKLDAFQLDNARGSLVFQTKSKRATPTSVVAAAFASASRGWRSEQEALDWEVAVGSVSNEQAQASVTILSRLCDASGVIACVVCDPGDCRKSAKFLAGSLGVEVAKVFIQDNVSDCYSTVQNRIRSVIDALPSGAS